MRKIVLSRKAVIDLYATGMTTEQVGERLGCSRSTVDRFLAARGLLRKLKRVGALNGNWTGGRYRMSHGYIMVQVAPGKYRTEHRVVMERALGRRLRRGEVVHHLDGDRSNNDPANLRLYASNAAHMREEHRSRPCRMRGPVLRAAKRSLWSR